MTQRSTGRRAASEPTVMGAVPERPFVVVTGAASGLGAVLAERLVRSGRQVVGLDLETGTTDAVDWHCVDVRDPDIARVFAGADCVVHLAVSTTPDADPLLRSDLNVRGTECVLTAAAASEVRHVVLVTSAAVHGASADNPAPIDDDAPLLTAAEGLIGDLLEIEALAARSRDVSPDMRVTVVRPAALVGAGADSLVTRHFASPLMLSVRDVEMRWQFVHADDVAAAIDLVLQGAVPYEAVTVGCEGWLSQRDVEAISGKRSIEVSSSVAFATAERLHRAGLTPAPASELAYVVHPWVVTSSRLRHCGWTAAYDNPTALSALIADLSGTSLAGRRLGRSDVTIAGAGAAGATVAALLGAAAFVRKARRARGL
ncbi:MAG: NAD-dependent epimerase/dehydratase family protein [Actinobacteria bacterium]|nr:NAD-dependent epimerase/dehydratase family protein [Actinomycetota bacterium]